MKPLRLAELQRQRDLVREHLAWLDREIAAARDPASGEIPSSPPAPGHLSESPASPGPVSTPPDPASAAAAARRGCFIFALVAALLLTSALTAVYLLKYRDRPLLFPEEPHDTGAAR